MKITPIELKALGRFRECCEDSAAGGHDVPKEMMQRLAAVGVVRTLGFGRHETTEFGDWLLAQPPEVKVPPVAVPHSWTLVPAEPDDAMQAAGAQAIRIDTTAINKIWTGNAVFRAMIAAAPIAPAAHCEATQAAVDVLTERRRQVASEGWTAAHDDKYDTGSLSTAAACYAMQSDFNLGAPPEWPWSLAWWKPSDERSNLVKAGALILAEIERLDRAAIAGKAVKS